MRKLRRIFSVALLVLFLSVFAPAQDVPDYLFLEVLDSNKKGVEGAKIESGHAFGSSFENGEKRELKTDEKGGAGFYLGTGYYYFPSASLFSVSKDGYFTFHDLGISKPNYRLRRTSLQLELLKIPQTDEEKRLLGREQQKREFMWAAKTGDAATVKRLLRSGISPDLKTNDLRGVPAVKDVSAIELAANSADSETVKALIDAGVRIRAAVEPVRSILLTYLLADPFYWHKFKTEAERKEILRRYEEGVKILLKAGADYSAEDQNKRKPVMLAAEKGYARALKTLLDKGFSPNYMDERGTTLLMAAASETYPEVKHSKVETVDLLLKAGADPNLSKNGCGSALSGAAGRGDVEAMRALLKAGARVNPDCKGIQSPLLWAVERDRVEAAKLLIEAGADKTAVNRDGENALVTAMKRGNPEMVQLLIDRGIPVNRVSANGTTALIAAINSSPHSLDAIKILLKAGADPNAVVNFENPTDCSTPLIGSVRNRYYNLIKLLIEHQANVDLQCRNGNSALVYAIFGYESEIVKLLIELGANPSGEHVDRAIKLVKTYHKEDSYEGKKIGAVVRMIEEARARLKP